MFKQFIAEKEKKNSIYVHMSVFFWLSPSLVAALHAVFVAADGGDGGCRIVGSIVLITTKS